MRFIITNYFYFTLQLLSKTLLNYHLIKSCYVKKTDKDFDKTIIPYWNYLKSTSFSHNSLICNEYSNNSLSVKISVVSHNNPILLNMNKFTKDSEEINIYSSINKPRLNADNNVTTFAHLRKLSFINFFINNMIDVPICFKKSNSLKFKNFELPILKFANFLMKAGKREKINRILFNSLRIIMLDFKNEYEFAHNETPSWLTFYLIFNNSLSNHFLASNNSFMVIDSNPTAYLTNFNTDEQRFVNPNFFSKNFLLSKLSQVSPVFSYFIYSVDKNIRKFSRGKSGKYTFVWKYVAPYKRTYLAMRLIVKDIKFFNSKKINERIQKTIINLNNNLEKSLVWKSKVFSHNYVFKNFRKTLMTSLRTSS